MNTWSFKALLAGATCLALAGCDDIANPAGSASGNGLAFAKLARGAVYLVPPAGYCIDKRSVRASFAIMARCDTLGGTATYGAPLAVMTAATVDQNATATAAPAAGETILARRNGQSMTLLQLQGTPPSPDMRDVFWRAISDVGTQTVGLTLYEPADGAGLGERAPDLLAQSMRLTKGQTAAQTTARQDNSATTQAKPATN